MITITIGGVDRTTLVRFGSLQKRDQLNQTVDTLDFQIDYHAGQTYRPETNAEVILMDGATKVFGGKIHAVAKSDADHGVVRYQVKCKDYAYDLDRVLVNEEYNNETVNDIIADIAATISAETGITFTTTNVACTLTIIKVAFSRVTVTEALQRLASITGFSWYLDYDRDIHFFEKNTEPAPFNLADGDGNFITESLQITNDLSQIRNRVNIKGGEIEGESRTETFNGDGVKKQFKLSNKFAHLPTVVVGGVGKTVGVDFIDNEDDFDCFWDYNQQYIRFKDTTIPGSGTNNISVTGIPLYNLVVQVSDSASITELGIFEFAKTEKTLLSREEAVLYAKAQLQAYAQGVVEGSFQTYTSGLRSGQKITVNSTLFDVSEDFLIQRVTYKMLTPNQGIWSVELATLKTLGIIELLIQMLRQEGALVGDEGEIVIEKTEFPEENMTLGDVIAINTDDYPQSETMSIDEDLNVQALNFATEFVVGPYYHDPTDGGDVKRWFILDGSILG